MTESLMQMLDRMILELKQKIDCFVNPDCMAVQKAHLADIEALKIKLEEAGKDIEEEHGDSLWIYIDDVLRILGLKETKK
jgi:hypothetical protein